MELKPVFYYLLLNFIFEPTEKTKIPLEWEKIPSGAKPDGGVWIELKPREN